MIILCNYQLRFFLSQKKYIYPHKTVKLLINESMKVFAFQNMLCYDSSFIGNQLMRWINNFIKVQTKANYIVHSLINTTFCILIFYKVLILSHFCFITYQESFTKGKRLLKVTNKYFKKVFSHYITLIKFSWRGLELANFMKNENTRL